MSCPYCHGTRRIAIEPGSTTGYECPDCREIEARFEDKISKAQNELAMANAQLVAAAPDLLWMLKRLTAEGEYGQLPLLTLQQAREVISKAEGAQ